MEKGMKLRGRPKRSDIPYLKEQGKNFPSNSHKCEICDRIFPRRKNLNTHVLTHSGDKNYICDFPNCHLSFAQSSHLKSHLLLHAKEKPFICPGEGCQERFVHANRKCKKHEIKLIKLPETAEVIRKSFYHVNNKENQSENAKNWFEKYMSRRERGRKSPPASVRKMEVFDSEEISNTAEVHDHLMEVTDCNQGSDSAEGTYDGLMEVSNKESSLEVIDRKKGNESFEQIHDGLMEVIDMKGNNKTEEANDKNDQQDLEGVNLFCSFLEHVGKKGGDSKALFQKCIYSVLNSSPNANPSQNRFKDLIFF